jgi:hypothetical protein
MNRSVTLPEPVEATIRELLKQPPEVRIEVGERLIASVPPDLEEAWRYEIQTRIQDIETGAVQTVPAEEVFRTAEERLNASG